MVDGPSTFQCKPCDLKYDLTFSITGPHQWFTLPIFLRGNLACIIKINNNNNKIYCLSLTFYYTEYVQTLLNEVWFHLEGFTNDYTMTVLDEIPEDFTDCLSKKLFASVCELVSNVQSVRELIQCSAAAKSTLTTKDYSGSSEKSHCFDDVVKQLMLLRLPASVRLFHAEQSHYFALNVLGYMVCSLDVMLLMQVKYQFQDVYLTMQRECYFNDLGVFILDQNTIKRSQILVQTYLLGGANERKVPPHTLTEVCMFFAFSYKADIILRTLT